VAVAAVPAASLLVEGRVLRRPQPRQEHLRRTSRRRPGCVLDGGYLRGQSCAALAGRGLATRRWSTWLDGP